MTAQTDRSALDPFVIVEGGLVQNDPTLPVFDLDGLEDQDLQWIQDLYERMLKLIADGYHGAKPSDLPPSLRYALERTEKTVIEVVDDADAELIALARTDAELRSELFGFSETGAYGERTAQLLARRVLGSIGIAVPEDKSIVLTDVDPELGSAQINCSQLQYAVEQYALATGEGIDADQLEEAIGWL